MSWIGITAIVGLLMLFAALLAAYSRGYREGYQDGEESGRVLGSLEALENPEETK